MLRSEMLYIGYHQNTWVFGQGAPKAQFSPTHCGRSFAQKMRFRMTGLRCEPNPPTSEFTRDPAQTQHCASLLLRYRSGTRVTFRRDLLVEEIDQVL